MNTILLLDLENTIIWDWKDDRRLMCARFPIIKEWITSQIDNDTKVGLFSWAVWHDEDLREFNIDIRPDIEITHKFKFDDSLIFKLDDILKRIQEWRKMPFINRSELTEFFKKRDIIEELWLKEFNIPDTKVILLDDTVPNLTLINNDIPNNSLELVDPWTFIKRDFI